MLWCLVILFHFDEEIPQLLPESLIVYQNQIQVLLCLVPFQGCVCYTYIKQADPMRIGEQEKLCPYFNKIIINETTNKM